MLLAKVKTIIQILIIMLKVHIFLSQIDIEVSRFLSDRNNSNNFLITKMALILNSGSSNSVKIAQQLFLKIIQLKAVI
jgi:hypothetical protein